MTPAAEASKQIERLGGLDFYPHNDKAALRELRVAGESAHSGETLRHVVNVWLEGETRAPKPAELRRLIHEQHSSYVKAKCQICDNTGFVTVWKLVTYRPGSCEILKANTLDMDMEEADAFRQKLGKDQDILSAAKPCVCLSIEHKIYTGERD